MLGAATIFPRQSGPCVICGDIDYNLSCGGPSICPKCDCGQFDAATVEKQARVIADLRAENKKLFDEHRIAMQLLKENTATLEIVATERQEGKQHDTATGSHR